MATSFPILARLPCAEKGPNTPSGKASPSHCLWSILQLLSILGAHLNRETPSGGPDPGLNALLREFNLNYNFKRCLKKTARHF